MKTQMFFKFGLFLACLALVSACGPSTEQLAATAAVAQAQTLTAAPTNTATSTSTVTPTPAPTQTPVPPTRTPRPSPTANLTATQEYTNMTAKLQEFYDTGYISTKNWSYDRLSAYTDDWAQINWYNWHVVSSTTSADFIVRSDITWESASKTPNLSGCGFVFRIQPNQDHYIFHLGTDGYVYVADNIGNRWVTLGRGYFGKPALSGTVNVTLIAKGNIFTILVDDKVVKKVTGFDGKLGDGDLAYTIISGSNTGFGTRCSYDNTDLWTYPTN